MSTHFFILYFRGLTNMTSSRPKIVIYTEESLIKKLDKVAEKEKRSRANLCEYILQNYMDQYEKDHGRIETGVSISKII